MRSIWPCLLILLLGVGPVMADEPDEVRVQIDWQGHPAMHIPWTFFAPGLTDRSPRLSWRHQFKQTVYAPYLDESGVRIFLLAAMAAEQARNP